MTSATSPISVDWQSGALKDATFVERAGMLAMGAAARTLAPAGGFGFSWAARFLRAVFPSGRMVRMRFDEDLTFSFPYGDGYWGILLKPGHVYEDEVEHFLLSMRDVDYVFIDCGANYGYWSGKASSKRFGSHPAIAVELDPVNFALLEANAEENGNRYSCYHRAIYNKDGDVLRVYGQKHEARSVVENGNGAAPLAEVTSVTLDSLVAETGYTDRSRIVLKLDVEGVEIKAIQGAPKLMEKDLLVIYEDHGNDEDHTVSQFLASECGMRLFAHENSRFFELESVSELTRLKTNRRVGYDFFATQSGFWLDRMSALIGAGKPSEASGSRVAH